MIEPQCVYSLSLAHMLDRDAIRAAVEVSTDPPSGVAMLHVFSDDGNGNGNCLLSLPLARVLRLAAECGALASS